MEFLKVGNVPMGGPFANSPPVETFQLFQDSNSPTVETFPRFPMRAVAFEHFRKCFHGGPVRSFRKKLEMCPREANCWACLGGEIFSGKCFSRCARSLYVNFPINIISGNIKSFCMETKCHLYINQTKCCWMLHC